MYQSEKHHWRLVAAILAVCMVLSGCGNTVPAPTHFPEAETIGITEPSVTQIQPEETSPFSATNPQPPVVTEHVHDYAQLVAEPSCEEAGYTLYSCVCGDHYKSDERPALGHSYSKQVIAPTQNQSGYELFTCDQCGETYRNSGVSKPSDKTGSTESAPTEVQPNPPAPEKTETENTKAEDPNPECDHVFFSRFVPATQYQQGCILHTCYRCTYTYRSNITDMLPGGNLPPEGEDCSTGWHTFDDHYSKEIRVPTCTVPGLKIYECVYCGYEEQRETELSDVHTLSRSEAIFEPYYRTRCCCGLWIDSYESAEDALKLALREIETHNANKDKYGYHEHYLEKGPFLAHDLVGPRTYVCMECGETVTDSHVNMHFTKLSN